MKFHELLPSVKTLTPRQLAKKWGVTPAHINDQLRMGVRVEREHTKDLTLAIEIALDHLKEDPNYYTKLKKVEGND